jgi:glycosyl hydrolase family 18 (putative chitinase)
MKRTSFLPAGCISALLGCIIFYACNKNDLTGQGGTKISSLPVAGDANIAKVAKTGPKSVVYIEVNSNNFQNAKCYTLTTGGQQLFDIAIIFAANINYNTATQSAVLYNNPNVSAVLTGKASYIQPLQAKGIKVMLSILGNHQGAGISNFTSRTAAHAFARQLSDTVAYYGLDGIDFDDEYADYGTNGTPQPNDSSFVLLLNELRGLLPTGKLISFYYYGPATSSLQYGSLKAGSFLNYSWNAIYGTFSSPSVPGMSKSQYAAAAVDISSTGGSTAQSLARETVSGGYGWYLFYDLTGTSAQSFLSPVSQILNGSKTSLASGCLESWTSQ